MPVPDYLFVPSGEDWPKDEEGNPRWIGMDQVPHHVMSIEIPGSDEHLGPYERPGYMQHQEALPSPRRIRTATYDEPHLTAAPKRAQARAPVGPKWKFVWITEGAVILLELSVLFGLKVLPWLIAR